MSEIISGALLRVAELSGSFDTSLVGEAYLRSADKRVIDRYGVMIMTPLVTPIIAAARLAVLAETGSPTIIHVTRVGRDGVVFQQRKIRSMAKGVEQQPGRIEHKVNGDPLITKVGGFIRKYSIDELPQLRNIRDGDMSLVGARPLSPTEFDEYYTNDGSEHSYTVALPGLTGLAQVNGREDLAPAQRREFIEQYADEASVKLDIDILQKTAGLVIAANGAY